jgi:hypothetical protein
MARIAALIVVALLTAMPAAAVAATNPFVPAPQQAPQNAAPTQAPAPTPAPVTTTTSNDGGISDGQVALLSLAGVALIVGIWMIIMRDARRATAGRVNTGRSRRDDDGTVRTGGRATKAAHRSRKLSPAERQRRKRGKAR